MGIEAEPMLPEKTTKLNNRYLGYVRVSSKEQEKSTSLDEQKTYVSRYAHGKDFIIVKFFGEAESASKMGRSEFAEMIAYLKKEKLAGIIFHKVDRSSRNPKDSAELYQLMMEGFELHFAAEGISTQNPMGRHIMYIMWGLASGYSENLRAEINKGIMGRLKQGRYPGPVPLGFKKVEDCKTVLDPEKAPLVKRLFQEYATGKYSVEAMSKRAREFGLTNKNGRYLTINPVHRILRETFYYGLITHKRGQFQGEYQPLISKALFDKVQFMLRDRGFKIANHNKYIFQGLLKCYVCGKKLKSITPKRNLRYYLCRNRSCGIRTIPERMLEDQFVKKLDELVFSPEEVEGFKKAILSFRRTAERSKEEQIKALSLELAAIESRLTELLQKYIDKRIDDETYSKTREALLNKQIEHKEARTALENTDEKTYDDINELLKLLKNPSQAYRKSADITDRRRLVMSMTDNLELNGKLLIVKWKKHFELIARRPKFDIGGDAGS